MSWTCFASRGTSELQESQVICLRLASSYRALLLGALLAWARDRTMVKTVDKI